MSEIICHCFEVSREDIEKTIQEKGLKKVEEVGEETMPGQGVVDVRNRFRKSWTK